MDEIASFVVALVAFVFVIAFIAGVSFLLAYPIMWLINYIFAPAVLTFVFGTPTIGVLKTWALTFVTGSLFKANVTTTSK